MSAMWGTPAVHDPRDEPIYTMTAKRDGVCAECEGDVRQGELMVWDSIYRRTYCLDCGTELL